MQPLARKCLGKVEAVKSLRCDAMRCNVLQPSSLLVEPVARRRHRLVHPEDIQQQVLERNEDVKHLVAKVREENKARRDHGVHEVMVRRRDNRHQDEGRISKANAEVENLPERVLAHFATLERAS